MALINPSSAVIAKARSKYGNRLKSRDYNALIKCESVGDVVQYLKTYTHYQTFLDKVTKDIHRGNLENIMREKQFESFLSLCRYNAGASPVALYILRSREIHELMKFITLLSINHQHEYLFSLPLYFINHTDIDLAALTKGVNSHRELLAVLEHTPYRNIISGFPPDSKGDYDLAAVETALDNYNLSALYAAIGKVKNKKDRQQLTELFDTLTDYSNYSRIKRLKKYYHLSNDAVRDHLLRYGSLTGRRLDRILSKESIEDISAALAGTPVGRKAQKIDDSSEMAIQGRYEMCRHQLYFSSNPEVVLLAYYILSETDLSNVIAIVEGVRYSMRPENIQEILIR